MRQTLAVALFAAIVISFAAGQQENSHGKASSGTTSLQQMFTKLENEWAKADNGKDTAVLDRILADDWIYLGAHGTQTKAQHLADLKSGGGDLEFETLADIKVRVFGDTAVVTGTAEQKNSDKNNTASGHYVWTDVFVKRHGQWQAVNSQDTLMSQN